MGQHTQGPWAYIQEGPAIRFVIYDDCERLAVTYGQAGQEDDARLMAAAPDLLAALEEIFNGTGMTGESMDAARAAIAKAKGTSNA